MKVAIIGYGKMGKTIEHLLQKGDHQVVGIINDSITDKINDVSDAADVAIEFSTPETAFENIAACINNNLPIVSGTTGWLKRYEEIVQLVNRENGAFLYSSNFSIGVNIFFHLNRYLAKMMNNFPEYEVLTEETHHTEKKDSPSGTAITVAEDILKRIDRKSQWIENQIQTDGILPIYAKRVGKVYGNHSVQYHNEIDTIKISHQAYGREGFAQGAISAAKWIIDKKGVFSMDDMLGLENIS